MTLQNKCCNENGLSKWFILISINNNDNLHDCVNTLAVVHILNCFARMGTTHVSSVLHVKGSVAASGPLALCSQVGHYKRVVKRFDDGHRLCNDLMGCLQERAKIEKAYGDQLTAWSKRWRQLIEKGQILGSEWSTELADLLEASRDVFVTRPTVRLCGASLVGGDDRGREGERAAPGGEERPAER